MTPELFNQLGEVVKYYTKHTSMDECEEYVTKNGVITRNTKLVKGLNHNVGLELLPASLSGSNLCVASGACKYNCLAFSGQGNMFTYKRIYENGLPNPIIAKVKRTKVFLNNRSLFDKILTRDLHNEKATADIKNATFGARLNTTSDVDFTDYIKTMPNFNFYDYTKVIARFKNEVPSNYHLTYSASEKTTESMVHRVLSRYCNVAMVFKKVPTSWHGIPVISGDDTDNRYNDAKGVIIGLKFKHTMGKNEDTETICMDNR